jgi:hypothetical protein
MHEIILGALHVVNIILIIALIYLYSCTCRKIKGKYTMGLLIFALLFLLHCMVGLFFLITMGEHVFSGSDMAAIILEGIKTVGFVVLLWISCE